MALSRFPHGKRGLKSDVNVGVTPPNQSLPTREAWIEIQNQRRFCQVPCRRFPHGKRGLKYRAVQHRSFKQQVASHTGSVD